MSLTPIVVDRGFSVVLDGEKYWLEVDPDTGRVTVDLQHHGMMGQPGEVERVGEGRWVGDRIVERTGSLSPTAFDGAESALAKHAREARRHN